TTVSCVSNKVANLGLRVIQSVRTHPLQLGKFLALHSKSLIIRPMDMENVHLHSSHAIQVALEHLHWNVVTANVDQQPTPGKPRLILNCDHRQGESVGAGF